MGTEVAVDIRDLIMRLEAEHITVPVQFHFGGSHPFGRTQKLEVQELNTVAASDTSRRDQSGSGIAYTQRDQYGQAQEKPRDELSLKEGRLPWNLNLGLSYSKSQSGQVSSEGAKKLHYATRRLNENIE